MTDVRARQAVPREKPYKITDAEGLHLWITPAGTKSWRWRTERGGVERIVTLGRYPAVSLKQARVLRDEAASGTAAPGLMTLRQASEAWLASQAPVWKPHHAADVRAGLATEVWPKLGDRPLHGIKRAELVAVLLPVEARGAGDLAHRLGQRLGAVWALAVERGMADANPAVGLGKALAPVVRQGRRPAVLDLDGARAVMAAVEATPAHPVTLLAHRLLALTALRPGELRLGRWAELDGTTWRVPGVRMKHRQRDVATLEPHDVPLSTQAGEALAALRRMSGTSEWLFPTWGNVRRPLSENALIYLLNRAGLGGRQVPHGWRATFSTIMNERFPADRQAIDLMLAHKPAGAVEAAYNRARHMARRRELAQAWANLLLDGAKPAAALLNLPRR